MTPPNPSPFLLPWRHRPRRRILRRVALAISILTSATVLFFLFGWRYGFTRLPEPERGIAVTNPFELTWSQVKPSNCWYWIRATGPDPAWSIQWGDPLERFRRAYSTVGLVAVTNQADVILWLQDNPSIERTYKAVLACPDRRTPAPEPSSELDDCPERIALRRLGSYALWLVSEAERKGAILEAFQHLLEAWQLRQMLSHDGLLGVHRDPAAVWRRLALKAPLPSHPDVVRLMASLEDMVASLPSLESAFCRQAWALRDELISKRIYMPQAIPLSAAPRSVRWLVTDAFAHAFSEILDNARSWCQWLFAKATGTTTDDAPSFSPLEPFDRPFCIAYYATMLGVTRTNDLARIYDACVSGIVARLRAGDPINAIAWAGNLRTHRDGGCLFSLDRPVVSHAAQRISSLPLDCDVSIRSQIVLLQSARLTLALRLYHETHSEWPQTLAQLVPDVLPQLPLDPFSGRPFLYRPMPDGYLLASVGRDQKSEGWLLSTNRLRDRGSNEHVFGAAEPDSALAAWKKEQEQPRMMDIRMLMRYGLLPKGSRLVLDTDINAEPTNGAPQ